MATQKITWEQYNEAIDELRDEIFPLTLADLATDIEEAMTRHGIRELDERYEAVQAIRYGIRKGGRYFLDLLSGGMTGELDSNRKGFFIETINYLKQEA